ncbi:MAG: DUF6446 family protein [Cognatishimia sp.]|uniref:DUF6446 family protein n=1 Tax=Cognatishimia sp. 1_MG-2023 TaxID=3062642 RepID=UPI0026E29F87|nr:DUF6446 family protein [Cognatishimia sp. 1_MG-2023]MDO6727498.1 DUF6446 family protein [Cognatishimia sp. 1_MG-2023]
MGKFLAGFLVVSALAMGIALYYFQTQAYYEPVAATGDTDVQMTLMATGQPDPILFEDFEAIDADSSPIRYRACFTTSQSQAMMTETYVPYETAEPLIAPDWFGCFDAVEIGEALENGEALAFMGTQNIHYGIDRVIAIMPDGRGFAWHQINACGEVVFDGDPAPDFCPPKPEGQ